VPKFRVAPRGPVWEALARETDALAALVRGDEVDLNQLGKRLSVVVTLAASAFDEAELPSVRLACAKKALDPKTRKSELEGFAGRAADPSKS
jgi:hypothetical protein